MAATASLAAGWWGGQSSRSESAAASWIGRETVCVCVRGGVSQERHNIIKYDPTAPTFLSAVLLSQESNEHPLQLHDRGGLRVLGDPLLSHKT